MDGQTVKIRQLRPNMKDVNVTCIVLRVGGQKVVPARADGVGGGLLTTLKVADPTGTVDLDVWDSPLADCNDLRPSHILHVRRAATSRRRDRMALVAGRQSQLVKTGEFFMALSLEPDMSAPNAVPPSEANPVPNNAERKSAGGPTSSRDPRLAKGNRPHPYGRPDRNKV